MIAIVVALMFGAPASNDLERAVGDKVRAAVGDAQADVNVRDVRVGDRALLSGTWEVTLSEAPIRTGRTTRVRGTVTAGTKTTWLSAEVEVNGAAIETAREAFIIARGERVKAQVSDEHFRVSAEAEALAPARKNERVLVRVIASQKTLEGKAVAPGIVEVSP